METENGTFQAGVGEIIVKNTDSVFVQFKLEDDNGTKLEGEEAVKKSIEKLENLNSDINSNISGDLMTKKETLVVKKQITKLKKLVTNII